MSETLFCQRLQKKERERIPATGWWETMTSPPQSPAPRQMNGYHHRPPNTQSLNVCDQQLADVTCQTSCGPTATCRPFLFDGGIIFTNFLCRQGVLSVSCFYSESGRSASAFRLTLQETRWRTGSRKLSGHASEINLRSILVPVCRRQLSEELPLSSTNSRSAIMADLTAPNRKWSEARPGCGAAAAAAAEDVLEPGTRTRNRPPGTCNTSRRKRQDAGCELLHTEEET